MSDSILFNHLRGINEGDPACLATHAKLVEMMQNGDAAATRALLVMASLQKQLRYRRQQMKTDQARAIVAGWEAVGAMPSVALVEKPLGWVAGVAATALNTAGNLLAGTGAVAAKPFHWGGSKLGNVHAKFGAPALVPAALAPAPALVALPGH